MMIKMTIWPVVRRVRFYWPFWENSIILIRIICLLIFFKLCYSDHFLTTLRATADIVTMRITWRILHSKRVMCKWCSSDHLTKTTCKETCWALHHLTSSYLYEKMSSEYSGGIWRSPHEKKCGWTIGHLTSFVFKMCEV